VVRSTRCHLTSYCPPIRGNSNKSPEIAELTIAAQTEFDPAKREEMYHQIQQMSLDDAQVLFLYFPTSRTALHDWVHGIKVQPTANYRMWEVWTTRE
jgi:ABC-type transport system substrate-binding protein